MKALNFARIQASPAYKPGFAYVLRGTPYLALTNDNLAKKSLMDSRGPGFRMPEASGFRPLPASEPTSRELADLIGDLYGDGSSLGAMGEADPGVVFAGAGEPFLRLEALLDTVRETGERRNGVPFRVNTGGVVGEDPERFVERFVGSGLVATGDGDARRETLVRTVSVSLMASDPPTFERVAGEDRFGEICAFVCSLAEAGVHVECTAVEHPEVDLEATKKLAIGMGARSFRTRPWFP